MTQEFQTAVRTTVYLGLGWVGGHDPFKISALDLGEELAQRSDLSGWTFSPTHGGWRDDNGRYLNEDALRAEYLGSLEEGDVFISVLLDWATEAGEKEIMVTREIIGNVSFIPTNVVPIKEVPLTDS